MVTLLLDVVVSATLELGAVVEVAVVASTEVACRSSVPLTGAALCLPKISSVQVRLRGGTR
ncbi:hypothetical protein [Saccharothrix luteola]|uniref:hypothetical protein n=1 Tax=Saccharothrix luteola TaxID=2893018 RepID=UPI001E352DD2|nr:hypothetical protein [Saccharothrix luteola]MCC8251523.1 hypothetical protein [Saccharothrix luteola]